MRKPLEVGFIVDPQDKRLCRIEHILGKLLRLEGKLRIYFAQTRLFVGGQVRAAQLEIEHSFVEEPLFVARKRLCFGGFGKLFNGGKKLFVQVDGGIEIGHLGGKSVEHVAQLGGIGDTLQVVEINPRPVERIRGAVERADGVCVGRDFRAVRNAAHTLEICLRPGESRADVRGGAFGLHSSPRRGNNFL